MTRFKLFLAFFIAILFIASLATSILYLVPLTFFTTESTKIVSGLIITLVISSISGLLGYFFSRYTDRPIMRIEHVNFKSKRKYFEMPDNIWFHIIHEDTFIKYLDKHTNIPISALDKNEFKYHHLDSLKDACEIFYDRYNSTERWTKELISRIDKCALKPNDPDCKEEIIQSLGPYFDKIENIYQSANDKSFFVDLENEPQTAIKFLQAEIKGLLLDHQIDVKIYKDLYDWANHNISAGENEPLEIDHGNQIVPEINIIIGISNVGRTPGLLRLRGSIFLNKNEIPIKHIGDSSFYYKINSNETVAMIFHVDSSRCAFQENKEFYENLIDDKQSKVSIKLELADNTNIVKKSIKFFDDTYLSQ